MKLFFGKEIKYTYKCISDQKFYLCSTLLMINMKQPIEPNKDECCNSGCNPCIFDVYEKQLKLYKKYLECGEISNEPPENAISQLEYSPFQIVQNIDICERHKLLVFTRAKTNNVKVWWRPGDHFLLKYSSGNISCTRAYTPLKQERDKETNEEFDFGIIVKVYEDGLVSNHLKDLSIGDITLWRGPYGSYEVVPNKFHRIIMIAQGTGIAPFISIIQNILEDEDDMTRIILFYCCRCVDNILLRDKLHLLKCYWNFTYNIFLSDISDSVIKYQEPITYHKLEFEDLTTLKPFSSKDQFLLCGSTQFMKEYNVLLKKHEPFVQNIILF